jgi:uncharacterized protein YdeI (YjbR/CyaY-like superfamily)
MKPTFFSSASAFRGWLEAHHATGTELMVGIHTKSSGKPGMTYPEALDEALCFGWIDGVRRKVDVHSFLTRFTPRKPRSTWSLVNVRHVQRLIAAGRMRPPGLKAYEARDEKKTGIYSFEKRPASFPPDLEKIFRAGKSAWAFWNDQPPGYRRTATWWVISAVRDETRLRRLVKLIEDSAGGKRLDLLI